MVFVGRGPLSSAALALLFGMVLLAGCGGARQKSGDDPVVRRDQHETAPSRKAGKEHPAAQAELTFPSCADQPCILHRGSGRYHRCLMAAPGKCAHFGPACTPRDTCMYDPQQKSYRTCSQAELGLCTAFGAACRPAGTCLVDPRDGLYRTCEAPTDGGCTRFGELCAPGAS